MKVVGYIFKLLFYAAEVLVSTALILADLSPFIPPSNKLTAVPSLLALGYEWLLLAIVAIFFVALLLRKRWAWIAAGGVILLSFVPINTVVSLQKSKVPQHTTHKLKVLTYNTMMLANGNMKDTSKPLAADLLEYIKHSDTDIVCLQEVVNVKKGNGYTLEQLKQTLQYPYSYVDYKRYRGNRKYGMMVFSRYPLLDKQTIAYESTSNQSDHCLVVVDSDTILLCNNHLESIKLTNDNFDFSDPNSDKLKQKAHTILGKMLRAYTLRYRQARAVHEMLKHSHYPAIVCGDFNDTPVSYTYRTIRSSMNDAYLYAHPRSTGHTFYKGPLGIRIDYILCSPCLYPQAAEVDCVPFSDHLPLTATLVW